MKKNILLLSIFIFALFAIAFFCLAFNNRQSPDRKIFEVKFGDKLQRFKIEKESENNYFLSTNGLFTGSEQIKLEGFEGMPQICDQKVYAIGDEDAICLVGNVGVHSQNLMFVGWHANQLSVIKFRDENGFVAANIYSDAPLFKSEGIQSDFVLSADIRNYEKDPLKNVTRYYYKVDQEMLIFDSKKDFQYN